MAIKSLYKNYFQKSRVFLYPALDIKRGVSSTPIETHISWKGIHDKNDAKLCCLYYLRKDQEFKTFEKNKLLNNKLFHSFTDLGDDKGVYVFDFTTQMKDWNAFINGKYSQFSQAHKIKIKNYIGEKSSELPYIESFLYPERHFKLYAEMMNVKESLLRKVGELCDLPDFNKEVLNLSVKNLQLSQEKM